MNGSIVYLQDSLYQFFGDRYLIEEAKYAAVHDFLSAIILYSSDHRVLLYITCLKPPNIRKFHRSS